MNKEKFLRSFASVACVLALCCMFYGIFACVTWAAALSLVLLLAFAVCDAWANNIKEEKSPLSIKKKRNALIYVAERRAGVYDEFVKEYSDELYNSFLNSGYIHEVILSEGGEKVRRWETTKHGLRKKVEVCS